MKSYEGDRKRFLAKAIPEADFKYFSKSGALDTSEKAR